MKRTWVGPGVMNHPSGDILPGKPLPADVDAGTLARLIASGKVIEGDLPVDQSQDDQLTAARNEAAGWKDIAQTNAEAHRLSVEAGWAADEKIKSLTDQLASVTGELAAADELLKDVTVREQEIVAANTILTDQLAAAQVTITELTNASLSAGAGPKKVEKPK